MSNGWAEVITGASDILFPSDDSDGGSEGPISAEAAAGLGAWFDILQEEWGGIDVGTPPIQPEGPLVIESPYTPIAPPSPAPPIMVHAQPVVPTPPPSEGMSAGQMAGLAALGVLGLGATVVVIGGIAYAVTR